MTREECIEIYRRYSRKLFNVSFRIIGDAGEAEEVMQDTILKFLRQEMAGQAGRDGNEVGRDAKEAGSKVEGWLVKTCVRASIDVVRKKKRERLFMEEYSDAVSRTETWTDGEKETLEIGSIKEAISELPDSYRIVLTLVLIEGFDYEEISEITGLNEGAIRTRYSRARRLLVEKLEVLKKRGE